jgi:hypothetical protein
MAESSLRPNAVNPSAGRLSAGAVEPRRQGRRVRILARLPMLSPVVWRQPLSDGLAVTYEWIERHVMPNGGTMRWPMAPAV